MPKTAKPARGRPPKKPSERKDETLRVPVTAAQKATISRAAEAAGQDFAAWARVVLLAEAGKVLGSEGG
jgi:uncharacterized protein (DUF1778 family)